MRNTWLTAKALFKPAKMNRNKKNAYLLFAGLMTFSLLTVSCTHGNKNLSELAGPDEYFTCSMDPQVIENKAGNCPICHMKLIKVKKNNLKAGQIKLSAQQIKLANITYDTLREHLLAKEITLTGKVTVDQDLSVALSARYPGRIQNLAVKNPGDYIRKGQLVYEIYSEDLNSAQQDYLIALHQSISSPEFLRAAKNKLLLYGMSESQLARIKSAQQIWLTVPVYSTVEGFVNEVSVTEGSYVSTGTTLFRIASLRSLWVEAQVYLPYLPYLKTGTEAHFSIPAASDQSYSGKVIFIEPQVQSPERYILARFQITNPTEQIKPGMLANIALQAEMKKSLALPIDAVIQDSQGVNVWVRNSDGVFENKMITVGMQNSRQIEITGGLREGDVVVVTGAYLLNSEYVFKKGANPMEGHHDMPGMNM